MATIDFEVLDQLVMNIKSLEDNLADCTAELASLTGSEYRQEKVIDNKGNTKTIDVNLRQEKLKECDTLKSCIADLVRQYNDIINPRCQQPIHPDTFWGKYGETIIKVGVPALVSLTIAGLSIHETRLLYKWTSEGYIPGRDCNRLKMPRP